MTISTTDWNDLTSQTLPSLGGATVGAGQQQQQQQQHRSLADLQVASQSLWGTATASSTAASAPTLRWNNPAAATADGTTATAMNTTGDSTTATTAKANESVEELLARHEQDLLSKILDKTNQACRQKTDQMIENALQQDWERDRAVWMRELVGVRTLGGAAGTAAGKHAALPLQASNTTQQALSFTSPNANRNIRTPALTGPSSSAWQTPLATAAAATMSNLRLGDATTPALDIATVTAHGKIVSDLKKNTIPTAAVTALVQMTDPSSPNNNRDSNSPVLAGYHTAWKWLQTMVSSPTYSSAVTATSSSQSPSPLDQATATLVHLCRQFQDRVHHRTRQATSAGQSLDTSTSTQYANDLATECAFYTQLELGVTPSSSGGDSQQPPWPVLYYCLRCGNARAALSVWQWQQGKISQEHFHTIGRILSNMDGDSSSTAVSGGTASRCFWEFGIPPIAAQDRRAVADWLDNLEPQQQHGGDATTTAIVDATATATAAASTPLDNVHRQGFLTLLSGYSQLPTCDKTPGLSSIEDYLFGCLWKAVLQPQNPVQEVVDLGQVIVDYGVNYFDDAQQQSSSGGWAFTLPLLVTQRYATALSHLAANGGNTGLLQAAHLAMIVSMAGIAVVDLDRVPDDSTTSSSSSSSSSDTLVASLLVNYANRLLLTEPMASSAGGGPLAALEYLARIPNKNRARKEVASLIARRGTGDLNVLAGTVNANGVRQDGDALDKHFNADERSLLLKEAAELLSRDKADKAQMGTAAMCYMLAGSYASVLSLLNEMLSPPQLQDENRTFWMQQTESFHTYYLTKEKRTHVMDVLERQGKLSLVQASRTMVEMNLFFQHQRVGRLADAWSILTEHLQLLPRSQSDVAVMEHKYRSLEDVSVKRAYPFLLVGAMETLYQEYTNIKNTTNLHGPNAAVARKRLQELQEQGRAIETFAGLLDSGGSLEQQSRISHIQARMVS